MNTLEEAASVKVKELKQIFEQKLVSKIDVSGEFLSKEEFEDIIYEKTRLYIINQRDFWGYCAMELSR